LPRGRQRRKGAAAGAGPARFERSEACRAAGHEGEAAGEGGGAGEDAGLVLYGLQQRQELFQKRAAQVLRVVHLIRV